MGLKKYILRPLVMACLLSFSLSCDDDKPAPDKAVTAAADAQEVEKSEAPEYRAQAQRTAEDYMKQFMSAWHVEGVSVSYGSGRLYWVLFDATHDNKERKTFSVAVRLYLKADGTFYWKAEPDTSEAETDRPAAGYAVGTYTQVEH
jgi:hypothetical protein